MKVHTEVHDRALAGRMSGCGRNVLVRTVKVLALTWVVAILLGAPTASAATILAVDLGVSDTAGGSTPNDLQTGFVALDTPYTGGGDNRLCTAISDNPLPLIAPSSHFMCFLLSGR